MSSKIIMLGVFLAFVSNGVLADDPLYYCHECRRPGIHAEDFGNYAFNAVLGQSPWIGLGDGLAIYTQPLLVINRYGQIAGVYFLNLFGFGSTIKIRVEKPNGVLEDYRVLRTRIGTDLRVGRPRSNHSGPDNGGDGGSGSSDGTESDDGSNSGDDPVCGQTQVDDGHRRQTCLSD